MQPVEQAVFTSTALDGAGGYGVTARSPGLGEADARELSAWGPSHDSMLAPAESLNFHPLPSGAHCLSRSIVVGGAFPGGSQRVYTHCLIVPPETLARFANNPFALDRAAEDEGVWSVADRVGGSPEELWLSGGAAAVDEELLARLATDPGPENMAALVQAARDAVCLAVGGSPSPSALIAGLIGCMPPECRLDFSFTTGLKFSPRRPFRLAPLSVDPAVRRWMSGYANVAVLDLGRGAPPPMPIDGWGQFVQRALAAGRIPFLSAQLSKRRFHLGPGDLPALGMQLLEELDAVELGGRRLFAVPATGPMSSGRTAHGAHWRFTGEGRTEPSATASQPTTCFELNSPAVLDRLERLDDLVYESINGQPGAMEQLEVAWPELLGQLSDELVAESREQYLRYALTIWRQCVESDGVRQSDRAIRAIDVLCLLFGDMT